MIDLSKLSLPGRADWLLGAVIDPTLAGLSAVGIRSDDRARQELVTISLQEARIEHRDQIDAPGTDVLGPALGLWQFERGGGVKGVLLHPASRPAALHACASHGVRPEPDAAWRALKTDDALACVFARLLLWTDPAQLPWPSDTAGGWAYYQRTWRPGRPHRETWDAYWELARSAVERARAPT